jgi:hypothetical protein
LKEEPFADRDVRIVVPWMEPAFSVESNTDQDVRTVVPWIEHKAYPFDYDAFTAELAPILFEALAHRRLPPLVVHRIQPVTARGAS